MNLDAHPATTPEIRSLCEDLGVLGWSKHSSCSSGGSPCARPRVSAVS